MYAYACMYEVIVYYAQNNFPLDYQAMIRKIFIFHNSVIKLNLVQILGNVTNLSHLYVLE